MGTTNLEDLLNQAEAQELGQGEWIEDTNYTTKNFYVDEHGVVEIKNKTIGDMSKHISVKGESYSQYIEFKIGRFFDGIDLTKMQLAIYFNIPGVGEDESRPINVYYNEDEIKFGWVIPPEVAQVNLIIEFCIYARGILSDGNSYVLKTKTAKYSINDGLEIGSGIIEPTNNWYLNFVLEMDEKVSQASENADRAEQAVSSIDGVVETVTTARDEVFQKASTFDAQHSEVRTWNQEAEQFRNEAEEFRNQAEAITGIGLAEEGKPGIVQPDGVTTKVDENGKLIVIGGGSGTTDYQALENKPSIAGIELNGDKSYDELGIASKDTVARNFETVNQSIKTLDTFTKSLDEDISTLDEELEVVQQDLQSMNNTVSGLETGLSHTNQTLQSTTNKVDIIIEKADLGIKEIASGEEIYLFDSANGKLPEFSLFGKATQNTTTGKNLFKNTSTNNSINGVDFVVNEDGSVTTNGTATADFSYRMTFGVEITQNCKLLGCPNGGSATTYNLQYQVNDTWGLKYTDYGNGTSLEVVNGDIVGACAIVIKEGTNLSNLVFKPMISTDLNATYDDYEPYTGGIPSPNPDYKQDIAVAGESYNLLWNTATSQTINGVEFVVNEDKSVTANGVSSSSYADFDVGTLNVKAGESYTFSGISDGSDNSYRIYIITNNKTFGNDFPLYDGEVTKTATVDDVVKFRIQVVPSGYNANNLTFYPMIRKASVKNDRYMPYGKGSVEVKSVGKNALPYPYHEVTKTVNGVTFTDVGDGRVIVNGTATADSYFQLAGIGKVETKDYVLSGCPEGGGVNTYSIYSRDIDGNYIRDVGNGAIGTFPISTSSINIQIRKDVTVTNLVFKPMLRLASDANDTWEPYKETSSIIPTENGIAGIPVDSGGNYTDQSGQQWICDEIVKYADGSGEKVQRIGNAIFDGSSDENWLISKGGNFNRFEITVPDSNVDMVRSFVLCSHAKALLSSHENYAAFIFNGKLFFYYNEKTSVVDFKTWLGENNVTIYYELVTPILTPLTAEEIGEIEKLNTFYQVTNISNDFDCGMKVTYVVDAKTYVDNKIAQIAAAVVNNI